MSEYSILWADDEIDLLKPHILFLRAKGYDPVTVNNGRDALELVASRHFDLVILDENMPGLTGLETLQRIKEIAPQTPVIMITKSEEENIMNQAVGNNIADYLIKPVNPNQILLSIKKNLHSREIVSQTAAADYQQEFVRLSGMINDARSIGDFYAVYEKLTQWELRLASADTNMDEMLRMQKSDADSTFYKFVKRNYEEWVTALPSALTGRAGSTDASGRPMMSPEVMKNAVLDSERSCCPDTSFYFRGCLHKHTANVKELMVPAMCKTKYVPADNSFERPLEKLRNANKNERIFEFIHKSLYRSDSAEDLGFLQMNGF